MALVCQRRGGLPTLQTAAGYGTMHSLLQAETAERVAAFWAMSVWRVGLWMSSAWAEYMHELQMALPMVCDDCLAIVASRSKVIACVLRIFCCHHDAISCCSTCSGCRSAFGHLQAHEAAPALEVEREAHVGFPHSLRAQLDTEALVCQRLPPPITLFYFLLLQPSPWLILHHAVLAKAAPANAV